MPDDTIFRALADPSRRLLLDQLFERDGRSLTELESQLTMTRFGVMKHLRLLEDAGLVVTRKVGREKLHYLNPVPIQQVYDRWIGKYAAPRASALADLKAALEGAPTMAVDVAAPPTHVYEVFIKATPEQVWTAITTPEFTSRYFFGSHVSSDLKVGSPFDYLTPDRQNTLVTGTILESDPPRRLVHTWQALECCAPEMANDPPSRVTFEISDLPGGASKLTVIHDGFEPGSASYKSTAQGWPYVLSNLKTLLETGEVLPALK